jgi:hypothetical protein
VTDLFPQHLLYPWLFRIRTISPLLALPVTVLYQSYFPFTCSSYLSILYYLLYPWMVLYRCYFPQCFPHPWLVSCSTLDCFVSELFLQCFPYPWLFCIRAISPVFSLPLTGFVSVLFSPVFSLPLTGIFPVFSLPLTGFLLYPSLILYRCYFLQCFPYPWLVSCSTLDCFVSELFPQYLRYLWQLFTLHGIMSRVL